MHKKTMIPRSCLRWKKTGRISKTVVLRWVPTGKIFTSSTTTVDSEPPHGSNTDITNLYECIQTLDSSACTSINVQEEQNLDLSASTPSNLKTERIKATHLCKRIQETIHEYYACFAKLINDMRNIKITMSKMQLNSKFVNNMFPEEGRFVTAVKLNRGLRDSNYDQLYAYLKQHEAHANENKMMLDRFTLHTVDPLALMSNVSHQQYYSQSSTTPPSTYVQPHFAENIQLDSGLSSMDNIIENLTNTLALLT
nr:integrase, catalytic region, zinc finger, CCHC-type, peptidase aspartic, catalytic [Tanacetum cinerariifolium]